MFNVPYKNELIIIFKVLKKHDVSLNIRIMSGELCFLGFSVPGRLGGVICKPEGVA